MATIDQHFADRLSQACVDKGAPVCAGIDPVFDRLPPALRDGVADTAAERAATIGRFVEAVLDAVTPHVPCVKLQSACFERYLWPGVETYHRLIHSARQRGLIVIGDAKRGDIGISSEHYAAGCLEDTAFADFGPLPGPDALTINSYLGADAIAPFVTSAARGHKGLFALVRTSNPDSDAIQSLALADGRCVADAVAQTVAAAGDADALIGRCGYSLLGAVVGATKSQDAARLRSLMPRQIFLVPGFGAQGATADDVRACFDEQGGGALITASRSILYAFEKSTTDWQTAIADAAKQMNQQIADMLPTPAANEPRA